MSATDTARRQQMEQGISEVLNRSATDMEFRKQLLSDPRAALSAHFGREIPATTELRFIDPQGTPTVVLPDLATSGELSEGELETVAGGLIPALIGIGAGLYVLGDLIIN